MKSYQMKSYQITELSERLSWRWREGKLRYNAWWISTKGNNHPRLFASTVEWFTNRLKTSAVEDERTLMRLFVHIFFSSWSTWDVLDDHQRSEGVTRATVSGRMPSCHGSWTTAGRWDNKSLLRSSVEAELSQRFMLMFHPSRVPRHLSRVPRLHVPALRPDHSCFFSLSSLYFIFIPQAL